LEKYWGRTPVLSIFIRIRLILFIFFFLLFLFLVFFFLLLLLLNYYFNRLHSVGILSAKRKVTYTSTHVHGKETGTEKPIMMAADINVMQ